MFYIFSNATDTHYFPYPILCNLFLNIFFIFYLFFFTAEILEIGFNVLMCCEARNLLKIKEQFMILMCCEVEQFIFMCSLFFILELFVFL